MTLNIGENVILIEKDKVIEMYGYYIIGDKSTITKIKKDLKRLLE